MINSYSGQQLKLTE